MSDYRPVPLHEWSTVQGSYANGDVTERMRVPNGWLYRTTIKYSVGTILWLMTTTFVPDARAAG